MFLTPYRKTDNHGKAATKSTFSLIGYRLKCHLIVSTTHKDIILKDFILKNFCWKNVQVLKNRKITVQASIIYLFHADRFSTPVDFPLLGMAPVFLIIWMTDRAKDCIANPHVIYILASK